MLKVLDLKFSETWVCPKGCKLTSTPCEHLNKLISNPSKEPTFEGTNRQVSTNVIDREYYDSGAGYVIPEGIRSRAYEYKFRAKMEKAGLEPVRVDILVLRFVYDQSLRDIAEELGIMSTTTVLRLLDESLATLKKRVKK